MRSLSKKVSLTRRSDQVLASVAALLITVVLAFLVVRPSSGKAELTVAGPLSLQLLMFIYYRFYSARLTGDTLILSGVLKRRRSFPLQELSGYFLTPSHQHRPASLVLVSRSESLLALPLLNDRSEMLIDFIFSRYAENLKVNQRRLESGAINNEFELKTVPIEKEAALFCLCAGGAFLAFSLYLIWWSDSAKHLLLLLPVSLASFLLYLGYSALNPSTLVIGLAPSGISFIQSPYFAQYAWEQIARYEVLQMGTFSSYKLTMKNGRSELIGADFLAHNQLASDYLKIQLAKHVTSG